MSELNLATPQAEINRIPCDICGASTVAAIAGGYCVDCVEEGLVIWRAGGWRRAKPMWWKVLLQFALAVPREVRAEWRLHQTTVALRRMAAKRQMVEGAPL